MVPEVQSSCARQTKPLTARQLEEIQQQAREEGYQQGVLEGRAAGERIPGANPVDGIGACKS